MEIEINYAELYANHTPGKWVVSNWVRIADGGDAPVEIKAEGKPYGYHIANICWDINDGIGSEQAKANAYLISQAPALKEDNERLQGEFETVCELLKRIICEKKVAAAISDDNFEKALKILYAPKTAINNITNR